MLIPPNNCEFDFISCNQKLIYFNILLLTIDISSEIIHFKLMYFARKVFKVSHDSLLYVVVID